MYIIINQDYDEVQILGHTSNREVADKFVENYLLPFETNKKNILENNERIYRENLDKLKLADSYENWLKENKVPLFWIDVPITYYIEHSNTFPFRSIDWKTQQEIGIKYVPGIPWVYIMESEELQ